MAPTADVIRLPVGGSITSSALWTPGQRASPPQHIPAHTSTIHTRCFPLYKAQEKLRICRGSQNAEQPVICGSKGPEGWRCFGTLWQAVCWWRWLSHCWDGELRRRGTAGTRSVCVLLSAQMTHFYTGLFSRMKILPSLDRNHPHFPCCCFQRIPNFV